MKSALTIHPLAPHLSFGARIVGLTQSQCHDPDIRAEINALFEAKGMIVFENVDPSDAMQLALSDIFGPLKEHPVAGVSRANADTMPGVIKIETRPDNGGIIEIDGTPLAHWLPWHFDHCYNDELNRAGVLRGVQITDVGGVTGFVDGVALYDIFPKDLLAQIEGREILYTLSTQYDEMIFGKPAQYNIIRLKPMPAGFKEQAAAMPRAIHPAVWTRASGEKCLHVSAYMAQGIVGAENASGNALLETVGQKINELAPQCSYHHRWKPSDMLIWDNWRMLHAVSGNRPEDTRIMHRTTIKGDYGLGRFEDGAAGGKILSETMV